uniref:Fibrinogen C-terminal domain-containing protein n=1 Tax=Plectus sambesii TaxID=2011161 RepID=A0A914VLQ0_9BILA
MTWSEAEAFCSYTEPNAHLTSITSAFENGNIDAAVTGTSFDSGCSQFWIGGNDNAQSGNFTWTDGSPWRYTNWAPGQPDPTQHCVSITARTTGQWKTEYCGNENCFICEMYMGGSTSLPPTTTPPTTMTDCKDWFKYGAHSNGIYSINPDGKGSFKVFCDMTTDGGGWTVFQRRIDANISFYDKFWKDYKDGFNDGLENNLWLGNEHLYALTNKDSNVELRIDLWGDRKPDSPDPKIYLWEKHINFSIDNETNFYTLHLSPPYDGNASVTLTNGITRSNSLKFSTVDAINNNYPGCFYDDQMGGWWLGSGCADAALNGKYLPAIWNGAYGFFWDTGRSTINPVQSRMMLRSVV